MSHGREAARSLVWTALESFGLSGLSFLSLIVLSRLLDAADFGAAGITLGVVQILNLLVEMTFHDALVQRRTVGDIDFDTAFTVNVAVGALLSAGCWLGAGAFAAAVGEPAVGPLLGPMSLSLPAMGFAASLIAEQRRRMTFRPLALRSLIGRSGGAVLAIGAALAGAGVWALVAQQVASVALASLALWLFAARRPRFRFSAASFRGLVGFGVRTVATNLLFFSVPRIFVIGIGALLGTVAAGYVTLAGRCVDMLRDLAAGALLQLSLPVFSRLQDDAAGLERHYTAAVEITATAMFPVFVGLAVTAPETVALVFGASWLPAAPYVALFALLTLHHFTRMFSAPLMAAVGRPHYSLASGAIQLLVVVAGLALFGGISLDAAMAVWAFRLLLSTPADMALLRRASGIGLRRQLAGAAAPLLLALAMAAVVLAVRMLLPELPLAARLAALVAAGVAAYLLLLATFRRALVGQVLGLAAASLRPAGRRAPD